MENFANLYDMYLFVDKYYAFISNLQDKKQSYELLNCIERYNISILNGVKAHEKFLSEVEDKKINFSVIKYIQPLISLGMTIEKLNILSEKKLPEKIIINYNHLNVVVRYGKFRYLIDSERFEFLKKHNSDENELCRICLLYYIMTQRGNNWAATYYGNLENVCETFASPFNVNFNTKKYFSLFELDKKFGSSGNFFEYCNNHDLEELKKYTLAINPPYTETILNETVKTVKIIISKLKDIKIVMHMPSWTDGDFYREAIDTATRILKIEPRTTSFVSNDFQGKKTIEANFKTTIALWNINKI